MLNATTDWQFGSAAVQEFLRTDEMKSAEQTLSFLLGYYPVLLYSGT